ncbi:MAG: HD family hydrolase [Desulfurococcales archaeon]|nr:HD family hydrolase [Desulfurococcales archaeon]
MRSIPRIVEALSMLARTGWMLRGIPPQVAETVAEHTFAASLVSLDLSLKLSRKGIRVDPYRAASIALIHDLAESIIGDIPKAGIRSLEEVKERVENEAFKTEIPATLYPLFEEYQEASTLEAIIARIADQVATLLKASHYASTGFKGVEDIISSCKQAIKSLLGNLEEPARRQLKEILEKEYGITLQQKET